MSYLNKFPIDTLKEIDQSFVRQISTSPEETTIVTAVINMGLEALICRSSPKGSKRGRKWYFFGIINARRGKGSISAARSLPLQFARLLESAFRKEASSEG